MNQSSLLRKYNEAMMPSDCGFDPNDISYVENLREMIKSLEASKCSRCVISQMLAENAMDRTIDYIDLYHGLLHEPAAGFVSVETNISEDNTLHFELKAPQTEDEIKEVITSSSEGLEELAKDAEASIGALAEHRIACKGIIKARIKRDDVTYSVEICTAPVLVDIDDVYPSATLAESSKPTEK